MTQSGAWLPQATAAAPSRRVVYLTFDDGPSRFTPDMVRVLGRHDAGATFFLVGSVATQHRHLLRQMVAAGHVLADHTWSHVDLTSLTDEQLRRELVRPVRLVRRVTGQHVHCFRPPYMAMSAHVLAVAGSLDLRQVLWDVDPADWTRPGVSVIVQRVLSAVHPGAVVVLHDGGGDRSQTVRALAQILPVLESRGFRVAPLPCAR